MRPPSAIIAALCTHGTCRQSQWRLRCPGVILEGTKEQGPRRCLNQTLSKGREAFAHRLPRKELAPPTSKIPQHPVKKTRHKDGTAQIHEREGERSNRDITQHKERVRLERKGYQGNHVQEEVTLRNQVKAGPEEGITVTEFSCRMC